VLESSQYVSARPSGHVYVKDDRVWRRPQGLHPSLHGIDRNNYVESFVRQPGGKQIYLNAGVISYENFCHGETNPFQSTIGLSAQKPAKSLLVELRNIT